MGCRPQRGGWRELASSCFSWGCPSSCGWASSKDGSRQPCAWRAAWALAALSLPSGCLPEPPVPRTRNCSWAAVSWRSTFPPSARGACGNSCPTRRRLPSACSPRRWRSVYGTAIFGLWAILTVSDLGRRTYTTSIEGVLPTDAAWSVSTGALIAWLTVLFLTSTRRYLLAETRASATVSDSPGAGRSRTGFLTEAGATSVAPLVALLFVWSAWPPETLSGVELACLAVAMALVHLVAYAVVASKVLSSPLAGASRGQAYGGFFEASVLRGLLKNRLAESSIAFPLRYARAQAFAAAVLLTLAVVFLLDGEALASAIAVEGALLAYLVRPFGG